MVDINLIFSRLAYMLPKNFCEHCVDVHKNELPNTSWKKVHSTNFLVAHLCWIKRLGWLNNLIITLRSPSTLVHYTKKEIQIFTTKHLMFDVYSSVDPDLSCAIEVLNSTIPENSKIPRNRTCKLRHVRSSRIYFITYFCCYQYYPILISQSIHGKCRRYIVMEIK